MGRTVSKSLVWDTEADPDEFVALQTVGDGIYRFRNNKTGRVFHKVTKMLTLSEKAHRQNLQGQIDILRQENQELVRALARAQERIKELENG